MSGGNLEGWTRLARGMFHLGRFRDGLEATVCGERGAWCWVVDRRDPPTFKAAEVARGEATNKIVAQLAAQIAMRAVRDGRLAERRARTS